ncbi:MAG: GGDEF domain-containing protein [Oscillospiraceae bacterium]|nr:GGDEF domain-containing protein [Oscillospiraceae bacterium]
MYEREQKTLDDALAHLKDVRSGAPVCAELFETVVSEYKLLLRHQQKLIKITDKASTNMITGQKEQINELKNIVHYDVLTGIYNRRYMEENLRRVIKLVSRSGGVLSVLMLDIDYFKKYNDTYGHSQGDTCLRSVAEAITDSLSRAEDFAARYGGEEFAVVLPHADAKGAKMIAEKIIANINALNIPHKKSEAAKHVTVSIGLTTGNVLHGQSYESYLKRADEALYMSKNNGRNQYTYIDFV